MLDNYRVLVLNIGYEPIGMTTPKSVIKKLVSGKPLTVVSYYPDAYIVSSTEKIFIPAVIKINKYVNINNFGKKCFSKKYIYSRDRYLCVYCGKYGLRLTIDHVLPRSRGGKSTFDNMVAACMPCNTKKGAKTPEEANLNFIFDINKNYNPLMDEIRRVGENNVYWSKFIS